MSVAGFVLGLVGTVLAVIALGWQLGTFLRHRPRPKLTPLVGRLTPDGLVTNDAGSDVREALANAAERPEDTIIGVKVVNAGRLAFHVAGWAIRSNADGTSLVPLEKPIAGAEIPHDIPPGGTAVFLTELQHAQHFAEGTTSEPTQFVLTVTSGARTYATKPVAAELFSAERDGSSD